MRFELFPKEELGLEGGVIPDDAGLGTELCLNLQVPNGKKVHFAPKEHSISDVSFIYFLGRLEEAKSWENLQSP